MKPHLTEHLPDMTGFLDGMIKDHGHILYMMLVPACIVFYILFRRYARRRTVHHPRIIIIPFQIGPRRETDSEREPPPSD